MRTIMKVFVVGTLGLAGLLVPAGYVHPRQTQASCNANGFILCSNGECGEMTCIWEGKTMQPGETAVGYGMGWYCDGCSGIMRVVGRPLPPTQPGQEGIVAPAPEQQVEPPASGPRRRRPPVPE